MGSLCLDDVIERPRPGAARDQDQETGSPRAVRRPGVGIDEDLDDERHAEERQGGEAGGKSEHQQDREEMFGKGREVRCDHGVDQRQLVFLAKQIDRIIGKMPAFKLGLSRLPEHCSREDAGGERDQRIGDLIQEGDRSFDKTDYRTMCDDLVHSCLQRRF